MNAPDFETACREVISQWRTLAELLEFAEKRHGSGNSNGGFGVTYPEDLDEYEIVVEKTNIPTGMLELYGYAFVNPPGYEILVPEKFYLGILAKVFLENGLLKEAERTHALINTLT